jgi:antirestriction protein ArdC
LGAACLRADLRITPGPREDHASYLAHCLEILREDKRAIFSAAAHARAPWISSTASRRATKRCLNRRPKP